MVRRKPKIVILGSGPCGLGAAWRLQELRHETFKVFEGKSYPGGLATSFKDDQGFTWDIGGHVQFSHYPYFDRVMDSILGEERLWHERSSWVWLENRFVPYPFQNNIRHLTKKSMWKCIAGVIDCYRKSQKKPRHFRDWITSVFGDGIAETFMLPYNYKVWAYHPEKLSYSWIGERVSVVDLKRVLENVLFEKDDVSWGPNNKFMFPLRGGTGEIWRRLYKKLDGGKVHFNCEAVSINTKKMIVRFKNGKEEPYDALISTIPLDRFIQMSDIKDKTACQKLLHSSTHIVGIGLKGNAPAHLKDKCWMYFPENNCPFYRVTVFSNYSPNNVPDIKKYWSLMAEVSESGDKPILSSSIQEEVVEGLLNTRLIASKDEIVDLWYHYEPYGYPTPSLERDKSLKILRTLDQRSVYSRGRFGGWKYEVSNQDHTFMQGVEAVNRILLGEREITLVDPKRANERKEPYPRKGID